MKMWYLHTQTELFFKIFANKFSIDLFWCYFSTQILTYIRMLRFFVLKWLKMSRYKSHLQRSLFGKEAMNKRLERT